VGGNEDGVAGGEGDHGVVGAQFAAARGDVHHLVGVVADGVGAHRAGGHGDGAQAGFDVGDVGLTEEQAAGDRLPAGARRSLNGWVAEEAAGVGHTAPSARWVCHHFAISVRVVIHTSSKDCA